MKTRLVSAAVFFIGFGLLLSCNNHADDKKGPTPEEIIKAAPLADDVKLPDIDTTMLKDEPSILNALENVVDARLADDQKKRDNPAYPGHYIELITLYTTVLKASTAYSKTLTDPNLALAFDKKVSDIQNKMYARP